MNLKAEIVVTNINISTETGAVAIDYRFRIGNIDPRMFQTQRLTLPVTEQMQEHIDALKRIVADMVEEKIREDE